MCVRMKGSKDDECERENERAGEEGRERKEQNPHARSRTKAIIRGGGERKIKGVGSIDRTRCDDNSSS